MAEIRETRERSDNYPADHFRTVADMSKPDWRQRHFSMTIEQYQARVAQYQLSGSVPEKIRVQWDTARNLWLFAWHVWRFHPVAEMHAYSTLEMSLRIKLAHFQNERPPGLFMLMEKAIKEDLLHDEHISQHQQLKAFREEQRQMDEMFAQELGLCETSPTPETDPQRYCKGLLKLFPRLRNDYAHGSETLNFTTGFTFSVCRDLIEQLFLP